MNTERQFKTNLSKIFSIIILFAIIFTSGMVVNATDIVEDEGDFFYNEDIIESSDQITRATGDIASVYIIAAKSGMSSSITALSSGHAFLAVRNDSNSAIKVGHVSLAAGNIMTIGSWGNIADGGYAYYNIEKYRMVNGIYGYLPSMYKKATVNASELSKLTNAINNNYTWSKEKNCARFARYCWNSMFSSTSSYHIMTSMTIETPQQLYEKIRGMSNNSTNFTFGSSRTCSMASVKRHTSSGTASLSTAAQNNVKGK